MTKKMKITNITK